MSRRPELTSLVSGILLLVVGAVLLAAAEGAFDLGLEWFAPMVGVLVGGALLASGLAHRDR
jgi:hypothetical protein